MIKIKDLEKIYRTDEVETVALNKLSMEVKEGDGSFRLR
jgi:putative ABC transport system ATP-binding protein